ncbi:MAG: ParB/RepB/Spo0J family partition protein [Veillonella sp.]|nr:ParB/RepB/Spo0J family partition protein [Veillonella sp.]
MPRKENKNTKGGLGRGLGNLMSVAPAEVIDDAMGKRIHELPLYKIVPNPEQPRKNFAEDALETLVESIKAHGIVQPIVVRKMGDEYQIVAGERRYRAASILELESVPVVIKDYSTEEVTEIALVENLQRQDLDPIEEAFAYQKLADTFKQTQDVIATRVGRSRSHVANMMRLLKLPEAIRNDLSVGELTIGQARPLLAISDESIQLELAEKIKEEDLNARQVEALITSYASTKKNKPKKKATQSNAEVRALIDRLKTSLGSPVNIKLKSGKKVQGKIEITFSSEDELNRLISYMDESYVSEETVISNFKV